MAKQVLLVSGGSGRLAGLIIEQLLERGVGPIVTTTRSPDKLAHLAARGVTVRQAGFDDPPEKLAEAFAGVDRALLISTDDIGRRSAQITNAVAAATRAGVGHLLYTSCTAPNPDRRNPIASDHFWSEQALIGSGRPFTILRHNMYTEHLYLFLPLGVRTGAVRSSIGAGARAYVTRADCARADAAALAAGDDECRILDIAGPAAVSMDEVVAIASRLSGQPIAHQRVEDAEVLRSLLAAGLPRDMAEGVIEFDIAARRNAHALLSDAVRDLTGQAPESVEAYMQRHVAELHQGLVNIQI